MIALRRLVRASLSPRPSCLSLACQKYVKEFALNVSVQGREEGTDVSDVVEDTSDSGKTRRTRKLISTGRRKKSDALYAEDNGMANGTEESIQGLVQKLKLLKKGSKGRRTQYLMDRSIAETLVTYLKRDLGEEDILVDTSPGLGVLTGILLAETSNSVVAYEPNNKLKSNLVASLLPQYAPRLQIPTQDFHKFYGYYIVSQREPENTVLHDFLSPMLRRDGNLYSPVKILGVVYDLRFVKRLIYSFTFQCCLFENISPDLYLFLPHKLYTQVHGGPNHAYKSISLIFQYYFDMETLHVVSKEGFYPIYTKTTKREEEDEGIYLVRISPKKDFFDKVPRKELESFFFFIYTMSRLKRTDSLIVGMERWIPDCGPEIIKHGIHVFARPRELTTEELFLAYKIFISLPSYPESVFHYQRQQFIARVAEKTDVEMEEKAPDENLDSDDDAFLEA